MNYRHIVSLSSFTLLGGIVGYFFHPLMLRLLSDAEFVELEFIMSMMGIVGTLFGGIGLFVNKELAYIWDNQTQQYTFVSVCIKTYLRLIPWITIILACIGWIVRYYFQTSSYALIMYNMTLIIIGGISAVIDGTCKARHAYTLVNFNGIMGHVLKILIWGWLAYIGAGVWGATSGLVIWWVLLFAINIRIIYGRYRGCTYDNISAQKFVKDFSRIRGEIVANTWLVLILSIMLNMDIMIASKILSKDQAATYSALSVIAKFIFFVCGSIEIVSYTYLVNKYHHNRKYYVQPLKRYVLALVGGMMGILVVWKRVLEMFKPWLSLHTGNFVALFIYYLSLAIISLYSKLLLGYGYKSIIGVLAIVSITMIVWLETVAHDIREITSILLCGWLCLGLIIGWRFAIHGYRNRNTS